MNKERFGFSTGALEKGDYRAAIGWMRSHHMRTLELSALRYVELEPLVGDLDALHVDEFEYVSFHAPSAFSKEVEHHVLSLLEKVHVRGWNIVVHPDVIYTPDLWQRFGKQLLIENMDRRKATGRTVTELSTLLDRLPKARLCLDVAHARQMDTTLTLLWNIATKFKDRIAEVHISELDSHYRHLPLSLRAVWEYRPFAALLSNIPIIIESMLYKRDMTLREEEIKLVRQAMEQGTIHV